MKNNKDDLSALVPSSTSAPMQIAEVAEIIGGKDENFLKEAMEEAGRLYAEWEGKGDQMRADGVQEVQRVSNLDAQWEQRRSVLSQENNQIWNREIENPYEEIRKSSQKIGDVRWKLLNHFFAALDDGKSLREAIDSTAPNNRTVKTVLRAFFKQNNAEHAKNFFDHYQFDTGNLSNDLQTFFRLFLRGGYRIHESNVTGYLSSSNDYSSRTGYLGLEQNIQFPLSRFLKCVPNWKANKVDNKGGNLQISETVYDEKTSSDEWINNLVQFLLVDQVEQGGVGDRKVENKDDFLKELVRFTEYLVSTYKYRNEESKYKNERKSNVSILTEDQIAEKLRDADELKMQLPYLYDNSKGRKLRDDDDIPVTGQTNVRSYYFAELKKNAKFPSHVASEFGKVIFQKWNEGDEKGIIQPIARSMGINHGYTKDYYEFIKLRELREKKKSAFVKHLPTVAHLTNFTAKDKARLEELEKKYGGKPDEYAEKLYDLYNLAIYFHKLGETLYDKGANEAQKKAGLEKMLFAAGLTRVLETMLATLEVRLSVMEVSRGVDIPEFLQFAEALEVMAKDPLSRQVEKVIDDSMNRFRAAIETTKAE